MNPRVHYWEIDALKGLAILGVLSIHANLLGAGLVQDVLVNRAVPILIVLFGVSSELWWNRAPDEPLFRRTRNYWRSRLVRLMPGIWLAVCSWWVLMHTLPGVRAPSWPWLAAHAAGYIPQVGTGWFVTLIVQLVVLFPLLHLALQRVGPAFALTVGLLIACGSHLRAFDVVSWMRLLFLDSAPAHGFFLFYYFWIFAPARFFSVLAGMALARRGVHVPGSWAIACAACVVIGIYIQRSVLTESFAQNALLAALDVPLTIALLGLVRVACPRACAGVFGFLGRRTWGIYLGQLVVHNALSRFWVHAFGEALPSRLAYFGCLLLGGLVWSVAELGVRGALSRRYERLAAPL